MCVWWCNPKLHFCRNSTHESDIALIHNYFPDESAYIFHRAFCVIVIVSIIWWQFLPILIWGTVPYVHWGWSLFLGLHTMAINDKIICFECYTIKNQWNEGPVTLCCIYDSKIPFLLEILPKCRCQEYTEHQTAMYRQKIPAKSLSQHCCTDSQFTS